MADLPGRTTAADVTVVVCTYSMGRWDDLERSLLSVQAQETQPAELMVVTDHADEVATAVRQRFPTVRVVPNERKKGLSGARNTALAHVTTPVVAFLDDDAAARAGWLDRLVEPFADASVLGVGGRIVPAWDTGRPVWFPPEFDWVVGCTHQGVREDAGPIRNPVGANMAYRTALIRAAGGFEELLGRVGTRPVGCEETEASIRMAQLHPGGVFWFAPEAEVDHRVPEARAQWAYFRSRCYAEGLSKAHVRTLSSEPLSTERSYATQVLPRAVARDVRLVGRRRRGAAGRVVAVVGGFALTASGYAAGLAAQRLAAVRRTQPPSAGGAEAEVARKEHAA